MIYRRLLRGILVVAAGVISTGCGWTAWRDQALRDVMEGRWHAADGAVGPGRQPPSTIEFYDAAGRHVGYGRTSGGTIELYDAGSRHIGYGMIRGGTVNVYGPDGRRVGR